MTRRYLVTEEENNFSEKVGTLEAATKLAEELIEESMEDGLWPNDGPQVYIYELIMSPQQVDRVNREDAEDSEYWPQECEYQCEYEMDWIRLSDSSKEEAT